MLTVTKGNRWRGQSAETIHLDCEIRKLHKQGRTSEALRVIEAALEKAHRDGPSDMTYEEFEASLDAK
jgi:hypothetical protein